MTLTLVSADRGLLSLLGRGGDAGRGDAGLPRFGFGDSSLTLLLSPGRGGLLLLSGVVDVLLTAADSAATMNSVMLTLLPFLNETTELTDGDWPTSFETFRLIASFEPFLEPGLEVGDLLLEAGR
jgi:hypothetical protein